MTYPSNSLYPGANTFPGVDPSDPVVVGPMEWDSSPRSIETGLDRGVLYPRNSQAVVWNGLTSVEEAGGEAASEYYIDGRPFLFLPKPKEYKATLKAYMYPDQFSSILGEVEVADGMFLDSQMGDAFGLSYRTRIMDNRLGSNAGYKIHLIYNATVVPSTKAYETVGNDINPVEFSWDIQAVPVIVAGYRPTAHITINTRNMDQDKLNDVEALIYGTTERPYAIPDAQVIFDLLSFGDTIVITDNGDGTWQAVGSQANIYMIGDEIFQIDNVDAVLHGDGTYTISTTN